MKTYQPLLIILAFLFFGTGIYGWNTGADLRNLMRVFMGLFFLVFSFFKLLDLHGFQSAYSHYDLPTKIIPAYGFLYPFLELGFGISYLTNFSPKNTNLTVIIVLGISLIGVIRAVTRKQKIHCACLGTGFNLPMSTVTIIEDAGMIGMAGLMLYFG